MSTITPDVKTVIKAIDWQTVTASLDTTGYAIIRNVIPLESCDQLIKNYESPFAYRKTVVMQRHRFGFGEYKYFSYPLPPLIRDIRQQVYPMLAPVANRWMRVLNIQKIFPETFLELQQLCHCHKQDKPTALILKYGPGGYNTLHQDLYGDLFFPMQLVIFLSDPEKDYSGGEFVLTEQVPRAQSKAIVSRPCKGDMLIFTTNFRPVKGIKGYYRANMKHGVSEVHNGERYTLGIIFHDALT